MELPKALLDSLAGLPGFDRAAMEAVHASTEQVSSIRLNPYKSSTALKHLPVESKIPWCEMGYYLAERPSYTLDPLFHAGCYYVQEASGMFPEQALRQLIDLSKPLKVLDLCAAPGGKSTLLLSLIGADSLLVSNELIRSRVSVLEENITKWGSPNVVVTNNDPRELGRLSNFFDIILIDAPCSGSGLFRRDPGAMSEWSEPGVQLCSRRQQRIIADVYGALKQGGLLIYSTCSYSSEENEAIADWAASEFELESCRLSLDRSWGITEDQSSVSHCWGYRFWPDKLKGEGFFMTCFRKKDGAISHSTHRRKTQLERIANNEKNIVQRWLKPAAELLYFRKNTDIHALPLRIEEGLLQLMEAGLYIRMAGTLVGKLAGQDFIPDHALALSQLLADSNVVIPLNREAALQYLRKEEVTLMGSELGWAVVRYEGTNLGWVKILRNRVNNYYPKEWRILKRADN